MKILLIILAVVGILAIIHFISILAMNVVTYVLFKHSDEAKYIAVQRDTILCTSNTEGYTLLPSISVYKDFDNKRYRSIELSWLKYTFFISYHFKTNEDEEAEAEARRKIKET